MTSRWLGELLSKLDFVEFGGVLVQRLPMTFEVWESLENKGFDVWDQAVIRAPELFVVGVTWQSLQMFLKSLPAGFRLPRKDEWTGLLGVADIECTDVIWHWCEDAKSAEESYLRLICKGRESDWAGWQSHADDLGFRLVFDPA